MERIGASTRLGVLLVLISLCLTLAAISISSGYRPLEGILPNLNHLQVQLREAERTPYFSSVSSTNEDLNANVVRISNRNGHEIAVEFPSSMTMDQMKEILDAGWKDGSPLASATNEQRFRFVEWHTVKQAIAFPFRWVLATSIVLFSCGVALIVLSKPEHST